MVKVVSPAKNAKPKAAPAKPSVMSYVTLSGTTRWLETYKFDFLSGGGWELFKSARAKNEFTTLGSLCIVAQAILESGWGRGNWFSETHNVFSLMGGNNPKYTSKDSKGVVHGILQVYASMNECFEAYKNNALKRYPEMLPLFKKDIIIPDDINVVCHQLDCYPDPKEIKETGIPVYAYNGNPASDYGAEIFNTLVNVGLMYRSLWPTMIDETNPMSLGFLIADQAVLAEILAAVKTARTGLDEHKVVSAKNAAARKKAKDEARALREAAKAAQKKKGK